MRILIVDDYEANARLLSVMLEVLGYTDVTTANDADQAIEEYARSQFDIIFMDVMMPTKTGCAAAQEIRAIEAKTGRRAVIVAVTGLATPIFLKHCSDSDLDGHLVKPVEIEKLEEALRLVRPPSSSDA